MQNNQPQQFKNQTIWIILAVVVLAVATYGIWTALSNDNGNTNTNTANTNTTTNQNTNANNNVNAMVNENTNVSTNENANINIGSKTTFFAYGSGGQYSLMNTENGSTQSFIPEGYAVVGEHYYDVFPDYLILKKDNELFFYNIATQKVSNISILESNLELNENKEVRIEPSITEKSKFYLMVSEYNPDHNSEMVPIPISTYSYYFDASKNELIEANNIGTACNKYDSQNQRFFSWSCGEGIGNSIPLVVKDTSGNDLYEVVALEDYGLSDGDIGPVTVEYNEGIFIISEKNNLSKIMLVDPSLSIPTTEVYKVTDQVKLKLDKVYPYGAAVFKDQQTIAFGGDHHILLLKFDENNNIVESEYIPDQEVYANFVFPFNGKLYYRSGTNLNILDLTNWEILETFSIGNNKSEITLIRV